MKKEDRKLCLLHQQFYMEQQPYSISPLGDSALIIDFGNLIEKRTNQKVLAMAMMLEGAAVIGVKDIVPAFSSITIHYDVVAVLKQNYAASAFTMLKDQLENLLLKQNISFMEESRKLRVPVCYAEKYAWDIRDVALHAKLTVEEVVLLHTQRTYRVYMIGFLPGFAYMGEVDERIAVPRKAEPRLQIEAGAVGIAGKQTGIYPIASPGGWQVIGKTPLCIFDKDKEDPVMFAAGDEVEFFSITEDELENY